MIRYCLKSITIERICVVHVRRINLMNIYVYMRIYIIVFFEIVLTAHKSLNRVRIVNRLLREIQRAIVHSGAIIIIRVAHIK